MQTRDDIRAILNRWRIQWQEWAATETAYRLVAVQEVPHIEIKVRVEDQDRLPLDGVNVLFHYPENYPDSLDLTKFTWSPPFSVGDVVLADGGLAKMVMSGDWKVGDFYHGATETINTAVLVADPSCPSDCLKSVGMLVGGPDDKSHAALRLTFRLVDQSYTPVPDQVAALTEAVLRLEMRVEKLERKASA